MPQTERPVSGTETLPSKTDWQEASPDEIKDGIARTRAHMDLRLSDLGRKLKPRIDFRRFLYPAAAVSAALLGLLVWRLTRPKPKFRKTRAKISKLKIRSAGIFDYLQALKLLATVVRKGKPAVFIVEPGKS